MEEKILKILRKKCSSIRELALRINSNVISVQKCIAKLESDEKIVECKDQKNTRTKINIYDIKYKATKPNKRCGSNRR